MTTGQPIKVPSDRNKYNNEFMENLRLQIKLNDQNLQANRLYLSTGQMPASTQMADTRSTAEKLADVEGLKRSIVADLSPVADTSFAFAIIEGVMNSPLNVDNSLFRYLAQNAPQLGQQLSKKYKFGIAGDANDVEIIVQFLEDAYNKTRNTFQTIKGYMNSSTNLRNTNTNLQDQLISELKYFLQRSNSLTNKITDPNLAEQLAHLRSLIGEIIFALPSQSQMNAVLNSLSVHSLDEYQTRDDLELLSYVNQGEDEGDNYDSLLEQRNLLPGTKYNTTLVTHVIDMLEKLPNLDSVRTLLNIIEKGIKNNSIQTIRNSIFNLEGLFSEWLYHDPPTEFNLDLQEFRNTFLQEADHEMREQQRVNRIATINQIEAQNQQQIRDANAQRVYIVNPDTDPAKVSIVGNNYGDEEDEDEDESTVTQRQALQSSQSRQSGINPVVQREQLLRQRSLNQSSIPSTSLRQSLNEQSLNEQSLNEQQLRQSLNPLTSMRQRSNEQRLDEQLIAERIRRYNFEHGLDLDYVPTYENASDVSSLRSFRSFDPYELGGAYTTNPTFNDVSSGQNIPETIFTHQDIYPESKEEYGYLAEEPFQQSNNPVFRPRQSYESSDRAIRNYLQNKDIISRGVSSKEQLFNLLKPTFYDEVMNDPDFFEFTPQGSVFSSSSKNPLHRKAPLVPKGKGVKKGRGISSDYRDFGINKINHKKLNDGILTIRRKSNVNIPDMPSKRISRKLQKIITHISGGGVPDFNDINNLDDNEKNYLHKLISKSNLNERLSVPAPSKDQEEKDFHQFEVMKGEIMSGNDSKELVKKFKVLILKLSKQNVLPKNEVNELLQDLLSLGY
jgi:hypothetical protein